MHRGDAVFLNQTSQLIINHTTGWYYHIFADLEFSNDIAAPDTIGKFFTHFFGLFHGKDFTNCIATIFLKNDDILGNVHQAAGKVTGVGSAQSRIRQTFAGTVGRDKEFKHIETFFKVSLDRKLDNITGWRYNETLHTHDLAELAVGTTSTR